MSFVKTLATLAVGFAAARGVDKFRNTELEKILKDKGIQHVIAIGTAASGSDWQEWKVRDIESGQDQADIVKWVKFSGASWTMLLPVPSNAATNRRSFGLPLSWRTGAENVASCSLAWSKVAKSEAVAGIVLTPSGCRSPPMSCSLDYRFSRSCSIRAPGRRDGRCKGYRGSAALWSG